MEELPSLPPVAGDTLVQAALKVLRAGDPWIKAEYGEASARLWAEGGITVPYSDDGRDEEPPQRPARHSVVKLVAPQHMHKLGRGGTLQSRQALVHSLVHTESWAIDLSWDIIARFGKRERMPREFFDDFVKVAQDEGRHFSLLAARLKELGSYYGALPAHDGLWDSAEETSNDLAARLAVEHCVHEARGLDVVPRTIARFRKGGDSKTAELLESVIYPEEITHCAAGVKWFTYLCLRRPAVSIEKLSIQEEQRKPSFSTQPRQEQANNEQKEPSSKQLVVEKLSITELQQPSSQDQKTSVKEQDEAAIEQTGTEEPSAKQQQQVIDEFHRVVRRHFRGPLKPPFNEEARRRAGFGPSWYMPLATKHPKVFHASGISRQESN